MTNCSSCRSLSRSTTIGTEKSSPAMDHTVADGGERPSGTVGAQPVQEEIQARLVLRFLLALAVEGDVDLAGETSWLVKPPSNSNSANLVDDEPALMVRMPRASYAAARLR